MSWSSRTLANESIVSSNVNGSSIAFKSRNSWKRPEHSLAVLFLSTSHLHDERRKRVMNSKMDGKPP